GTGTDSAPATDRCVTRTYGSRCGAACGGDTADRTADRAPIEPSGHEPIDQPVPFHLDWRSGCRLGDGRNGGRARAAYAGPHTHAPQPPWPDPDRFLRGRHLAAAHRGDAAF